MKKFLKVIWTPIAYFVLQNLFVLLLFLLAILISYLTNSSNINLILSNKEEIMNLVIKLEMPSMLMAALSGIFIFGFIYYRKEAQYISPKKFGISGFSITFFGALLCYFISSIIVSLLQPIFGSNETLDSAILAGGFLINIITVGIAVPIVEEIIFRGMVFSRIRRYLGTTPAIFLSALLFGLVHFSIVQSIYATIIGIFLAVLAEKFNSIKAPIIAHITINSLSMILLYVVK